MCGSRDMHWAILKKFKIILLFTPFYLFIIRRAHLFLFQPPPHSFDIFLYLTLLLCLTLHRLSSYFNSFYLLFFSPPSTFSSSSSLAFAIRILPFSTSFFIFYFRCTSWFFLYSHSTISFSLRSSSTLSIPTPRSPSLIFGFLWFFSYSMTTITIFIHFLLFVV